MHFIYVAITIIYRWRRCGRSARFLNPSSGAMRFVCQPRSSQIVHHMSRCKRSSVCMCVCSLQWRTNAAAVVFHDDAAALTHSKYVYVLVYVHSRTQAHTCTHTYTHSATCVYGVCGDHCTTEYILHTIAGRHAPLSLSQVFFSRSPRTDDSYAWYPTGRFSFEQTGRRRVRGVNTRQTRNIFVGFSPRVRAHIRN